MPPCTPDNGILFLNNDIRVTNPTMAKTPPPPMWGDVIEEDLYDYSQPFYDSKKAAEAIFKQRQLEGLADKKASNRSYKVKAQLVFDLEPVEEAIPKRSVQLQRDLQS